VQKEKHEGTGRSAWESVDLGKPILGPLS